MTSGRSDLVAVAVFVRSETYDSWLLDGGDGSPRWVPKAQCEVERLFGSDAATATMPEWLAIEKGFV